MGTQTLIWARAVSAGTRVPAGRELSGRSCARCGCGRSTQAAGRQARVLYGGVAALEAGNA